MNKKLIEYLIIAMAFILLIYGGYSLMNHKYLDKEAQITDSISMYYPSSSEYEINNNTIEFRNSYHDFYDMDVSELKSSDKRITTLLNHYANLNQGTIDYINETCYVVSMEFEDGSGFKYHSMIIPLDSFNKDDLTFKNETHVYLFDGNDSKFVINSAFNSQVII